MKNTIKKYFIITCSLLALNACKLEEVIDPNFPSVGSVVTNASKSQLNNLAVGQVSIARNGLATYLQVTGTIGKELFNFNTTESRWMTELNGLRPIDNSAFYNGATTGFGLPIRQANIIITSVDNTNSVTAAEKNAYKGLANTFKGLAYLYQLNVQYKNGVRLDVTDPFKPSKPASYEESLKAIAGFLDEGATQLDGAGTSFPFPMPSGFAGFDTPSSFKRFNRAIALRIAIYQQDWAKAETLLSQTFFSESGSLTAGPRHTFSPSAPDFANPLINTSSVRIVAVEKLVTDAEAGDKRLDKLTTLSPALSYTSGLTYSSRYLFNIYATGTTPVPIIRNEELVLIAAEIAAQRGRTTDAVKFINIVRTAAGLPNYSGATTRDALINAILKERLYSLWYEGHRWIDMRRYDKISEIHLPVAGMKVLLQLERPVQEVNWDNSNP
ncbi:MAG: RagB/SusD family nutrient uptake outer membrane protein [Cytophagales bacterium]|nr:MAG: RagB/SusD family nutrient uptake outer membrane protein [Cytophagales bacterium]